MKQRGKKTTSLPRSDSIGSNSGRKYLAPTLSDPSARQEKEKIMAKKRTNRPPGNIETFVYTYVLKR